MTELLAAGGCYNSMRYGRDGAGAGSRDWVAAANTAGAMFDTETLILAVCIDADDMNDATDATFKIQWKNDTDAGAFADLAGTGEIQWAEFSDLTDGATVTTDEDSGGNSVNCAAKGWSRRDGLEKMAANGFTRTVNQDAFEEFHWAISLSATDSGDAYSFRLTQSDATVIGTMSTALTVTTPGTITGTTKDTNGDALGSCFVACFEKTEGGGPPHDYVFKKKTTSHASTGAYSLSGINADGEFFVYSIKEDSPHVFDCTDDVLDPI